MALCNRRIGRFEFKIICDANKNLKLLIKFFKKTVSADSTKTTNLARAEKSKKMQSTVLNKPKLSMLVFYQNAYGLKSYNAIGFSSLPSGGWVYPCGE